MILVWVASDDGWVSVLCLVVSGLRCFVGVGLSGCGGLIWIFLSILICVGWYNIGSCLLVQYFCFLVCSVGAVGVLGGLVVLVGGF